MNTRVSLIAALLLALCSCAFAQINASVTYTISNDWGAAANFTMRLNNHGTTPIPAWPLEFDYARTVETYNNARVTSHVGQHWVLNREDYYPAEIPAGGSLYFDGKITPGSVGTDLPINVTLAGQPVGGKTFSIADATVAEGNSGTTNLVFTVTMSAAPAAGQTATVQYATASGSATTGVDFTAASGTLTFNAGETAKTITVAVAGDTAEENDETLTVTLSNATGGAISDGSATGTITNDDVIFSVSIADAGAFEGDSATTTLNVPVTISPSAIGTISVSVASQNGSATAGPDFTAVSQTVTFNAGETTKNVPVAIVGDTTQESVESFTLTLSNPSASNVVIADGQATVLIYDNDGGTGGVLLNEICSAPSSRKLRWLADGSPRLGMGVPWVVAGFADAAWQSGALPAGYGHAGLGTDTAAQMAGRTPSLYLRKTFTVSAADAASGAVLNLTAEFDDGFIAYLNGVEVARANMGAAKMFVFAAQEAFNARPSSSVQTFPLGAASARLVAGTNVLAIHAANAVTDPAANNFAMTPTFRINAGLAISGGTTLVGYGAAGGSWKMFAGLAEPSGGVFDPVLLTGNFTPPTGQEEDFEDIEQFSDWVELNNYGASPVNIGGWALSDEADTPMKWLFPAGTTIPAGGHLLVLCDDREESNGFTALTTRTLISPGATWKYYAQDAAPPVDWNARTFADGAWASGAAPLGYSPSNEDGAATIIAGGVNTHITDYFRRHFTVTDPATFTGVMTLRFQRDDGIVVWLNGALLASDNMTLPATHTTVADANVADEAAWVTRTVPLTGLVAGDNVIAVEVHQNSSGSSDARFDLSLAAYENVPGAPAAMLHASFNLDADGEPLRLSNASGALVDTIATPPKQTPFYTWGRSAANPAVFGFLEATPGAANTGTALTARVATPDFVKADLTPLPSGFYATNQMLVLRCTTAGATIRYTTDGSDPLETGNGTTYSGPITLTAPNDKTAVIIRARAFAAGMLASKSVASTYLIAQHTGLRAMPVLSLVQDAGRAFFLPGGVMAISGGSYDGNTLWQPGTIASYNVPQHHGAVTERETSVELIYPDGSAGFRDDVGLRIAGSPYGRPRYRFQQTADSPWTIWEPKEKGSFNLVWRGDYGARDLDFQIFPGWDTRTFKQLRLRAGSNDNFNPFISDEYMRRLLGEMGHDHLRGMFAMLYVNGSFKGMYNVCERLRNDTFQNHFRTGNDFDVKYVNEFSAGDNVAHTAWRATYDKDLSLAANYTAMRDATDLVNVADYYVLNIFANTWDWATWQAGANNYVLYRERVPSAKWRFTVWDGEGTFNNQSYFAQTPSFNIITNHLTGSDDTNELATIWKRLVGVAPFTGTNTKGNLEFRLLVADRINKHLWNGGVLDDRTPTGRFVSLKNELRAMVKTGVDYLNNAFREDWFDAWVNPSTGRRAYLFGAQGSQLRDAGVWPLTEPPVFSQHGGAVPTGFGLTMTSNVATGGQTATIYYTLNGPDPRVEGGATAADAQTYGGAVTLNKLTTVRARAKNNTTGEWSALTEAYFSTNTVPASAANLVVAEIMYHPPDATAAEEAAGFTDRDDFEFIRLRNIGPAAVSLAEVAFTAGITFDFTTGDVPAVAAGGNVLVVRNRAAFRARYGTGYDALIAGEYVGNIANGGEQLALTGPDGPDADAAADVLRDFTYSDDVPWPTTPDGEGASLILKNPTANPDHTLAANWTASAMPGGMPGGDPPPFTFAAWRALHWSPADAANNAISGALADPNADGAVNLLAYGLGYSPHAPGVAPIVRVENFGGTNYLTVEIRTLAGASDITVSPQVTGDFAVWQTSFTLVSGPTPNDDGTVTRKYRDTLPATGARRFVRVLVSMP